MVDLVSIGRGNVETVSGSDRISPELLLGGFTVTVSLPPTAGNTQYADTLVQNSGWPTFLIAIQFDQEWVPLWKADVTGKGLPIPRRWLGLQCQFLLRYMALYRSDDDLKNRR